MAYFDWNATAPMLPAAREAWLEAAEAYWANPSTPYRLGVRARLVLDEARASVAGLLGVQSGQIIFTSGATESNNGFIREMARKSGPDEKILISAIEHPSVRATALQYWGTDRVGTIPVNPGGLVDLNWLEKQLARERPGLVSVMAVNNETGVIQPWEAIAELCCKAGVAYHCDAVQWMGKQQNSLSAWDACAAVTASGHKFGGPKGTGFLVLGNEWRGMTIQAGGSQEFESRSGTENIPGILGMVTALKARMGQSLTSDQRLARDQFEAGLEALWPDEVVFHGKASMRSWNTCSVSLPSHPSERWISRLDRLGFQVSSGSACSTGREGPSTVLKAMNVEAEVARRTIRISSGWETQAQDWLDLLNGLREVRSVLDDSGPPSDYGQVIEL